MAEIAKSASRTVILRLTVGISSLICMMSLTFSSSFLPSVPLGCRDAKSACLNLRASSSETARASPITNIAVVLAVGTRFRLPASRSTEVSSTISDSLAREDLRRPAKATTVSPIFLKTWTISNTSLVSPLLDSATITSSLVTIPRSPCRASPGCIKIAGVPELARVEAIF